ncbi:phage late control D family protein [Caminibacter profundus]
MVNFKIIANNKDITETIQKNLISLSLIDEVGISADEITLKVRNDFKRPSYGDELKVWIQDKYYGIYIVQTTTKTQSDLTIKATATNFTNSLKKKYNRSFENIKVCELISKLAAENNLKSKCDIDFTFKHLAQTNESDLNLLTRLAKQLNAQFNIKNDTIIFIKTKQENESLPKFEVDIKEVISYSIKYNAKTMYKSVKAIYHDTKENKQKEITYLSGEPQYIFQDSFKSEAEAYKTAKSYYEMLNKGIITGNLTIVGKEIRAGGILVLTSFGEDDGEYSIKKVTHNLSGGGYTCRVEFEK